MADSSEIIVDRIQPFLKWAGGKRWLVEQQQIASCLALSEGTYFEPFLGGAAVFFSVRPKRAVLSDLNSDLIRTYQAIADDWNSVQRLLREHAKAHCSGYYYCVRSSSPSAEAELAARFIYLNRVCWNGLYRVNKQGRFNVPIGSKTAVLLDSDDFLAISNVLSQVTIRSCDFAQTIQQAGSGDFVFADPPYTVRHNVNGFIKYNETIFSWKDQIRLRDELLAAKSRGANILCTNANHRSIRDLYRGEFELNKVKRYSSIAGAGGVRGQFAELLISA